MGVGLGPTRKGRGQLAQELAEFKGVDGLHNDLIEQAKSLAKLKKPRASFISFPDPV